MFGVGVQEMMLIGLLLLVIFGPARVGQMARDLGRFAYKAHSSVEEFKSEFAFAQGAQEEHPHREDEPEESQETTFWLTNEKPPQ